MNWALLAARAILALTVCVGLFAVWAVWKEMLSPWFGRERRYRVALEHCYRVLGPKPPDCGCDGCSAEMHEALRTIRKALGKEEIP